MGVRVRPQNSRKPPTIIRTAKGVVSNASVWDTQSLLPHQDITPKQQQWSEEAERTPQTGSFMHLHLGEFTSCKSCKHTGCVFKMLLDYNLQHRSQECQQLQV